MTCPECEANGLKSRVYSNGGSRTLMGFRTYYDEDGEYHIHDPNHFGESYDCSEGHSFVRITRNQCPTCGDWDARQGDTHDG